ncbi:hypothetical protein GARC_2520 [Paraglaciecola arctica BSs20135]|uniref:Uncharacterized protein n=1 Tax=Paraglaciecola arctica BSs20135 TaxID=493475 RepID=K6Y698_9ALTE|nr:hypothetical protein GARC_2520 [Paraglaciecola arctica BSs20135]
MCRHLISAHNPKQTLGLNYFTATSSDIADISMIELFPITS